MTSFRELKKFFLYILIGSLIVSALVAVVVLILGQFNEITMRVFITLLMVVVHSLISLGFIMGDERQNTFESLVFFTNIFFVLIVISFITSIFGVWEIISGDLLTNLYQTYFILGFAALHCDILYKAIGRRGYMDLIIYLNFVFIAVVVLMLQPMIYVDNAYDVLGGFYFRLLGAASIIDGTLSILTMIFYKLYMHNNPTVIDPLQPTLQGQEPKKGNRGWTFWVWILIVYLLIQLVFTGFNFF